MDKQLEKVTDIIAFCAKVEREEIPVTFEERLKLVDATITFASTVKPIYEKYKGGNDGNA